MKTADAFKHILKIENSINSNAFVWNNLDTWPLVRKIIWFKLISISPVFKDINLNQIIFLTRQRKNFFFTPRVLARNRS